MFFVGLLCTIETVADERYDVLQINFSEQSCSSEVTNSYICLKYLKPSVLNIKIKIKVINLLL